MDGLACMLSKKCRREKSEAIVKNMNEEQRAYDTIYEEKENKN